MIHSPRLKDVATSDIESLTGRVVARHVRALLAADRTLAPGPRHRLLAPLDRSAGGVLRRLGEAASRRIARFGRKQG